MVQRTLENLNIQSQAVLLTPNELKSDIALSEAATQTIAQGRSDIESILERRDHRIFVVIGPCSIHDIDAAKDYAQRLKALADQVGDTLLIVMRVYFEKPRTTVG